MGQLKNEVGTNGIADVGGVNVVIDATQVDEVQRLHVKVGTAAKIYYTSLDTGKEYEVGVVTSGAASTTTCATATKNGIIENMFEAIPDDVVPGIVVSGPNSGDLAYSATGAGDS